MMMAPEELQKHVTPSGAEHSLIAGTAVVDASEDQQSTNAAVLNKPSVSTVVDISPDAKPAEKQPKSNFWSSIVKGALVAEEHLAELFGLNQSKYQWAVDEFMDQQLSGEGPQKPSSPSVLNEQEMHPRGREQTMQRDANEVADVHISLSP